MQTARAHRSELDRRNFSMVSVPKIHSNSRRKSTAAVRRACCWSMLESVGRKLSILVDSFIEP
jgi:hypothetical protein